MGRFSRVTVLAALSGLADVDAINLSLARMAGAQLSLEAAALGIGVAVISNTLIKMMIVLLLGAKPLVMPVLIALGAGLSAGIIAALFT